MSKCIVCIIRTWISPHLYYTPTQKVLVFLIIQAYLITLLKHLQVFFKTKPPSLYRATYGNSTRGNLLADSGLPNPMYNFDRYCYNPSPSLVRYIQFSSGTSSSNILSYFRRCTWVIFKLYHPLSGIVKYAKITKPLKTSEVDDNITRERITTRLYIRSNLCRVFVKFTLYI